MNNTIFSKFYLISDNSKNIEELIPLGVKSVQLRIKSDNLTYVKQEILKAKYICETNNCILIINDYWQLALECEVKHIHLGQEDLQACDIQELAKANLQIGISTHDMEELTFALSLQNLLNINYIALGPIYPTRLKQMRFSPQGLQKITEWKKIIKKLPLVAIGGLTPERAKLCLDAGADSTAVVTDISLNESPIQRTLEWINNIQNV